MRDRIDITEVEQATKIRAKYLRAIENEEWGLLPGSTFVKSFIRTYADYLGVDSRSLVEEYKLRYERPSDAELRAVSPGLSRDRRGRGLSGGRGGGGGGGLPRWAITVGLIALLLGALYLVGTLGGDGDDGSAETTPTTTQPAGSRGGQQRRAQRQAPPRTATRTEAGLRLTPTGDVYVCLVDQGGNVLIPGTIYGAGETIPVRRAAAMRLTLGNGNVEMVVNGRAVEVPASADPLGYALTTRGAAPLPEDQRPDCQ